MKKQWSEKSVQWPARRGFSLVEVLLAIFILGIGMIMVASVFPVGANWTRQTTESSVAQNVAQNAVAVISDHYGPNGDLHAFFAPDYFDPSVAGPFPLNARVTNSNSVLKSPFNATVTPFRLQALPGFGFISPHERAYQFGNPNPFPASNPPACTYFWTALVRLNPSHRGGGVNSNNIQPSSSYKYDLYILVFRKGAPDQRFSPLADEVAGTRNNLFATFDEQLIPSVGYAAYNAGQYDVNRTPSVYNAVPPMGQFGIGVDSGTVFRQTLNTAGATAYKSATPQPYLIANPLIEPIINCPAADGTNNSASPLIYIYQTTLSF